jgi:hypothetical protein
VEKDSIPKLKNNYEQTLWFQIFMINN